VRRLRPLCLSFEGGVFTSGVLPRLRNVAAHLCTTPTTDGFSIRVTVLHQGHGSTPISIVLRGTRVITRLRGLLRLELYLYVALALVTTDSPVDLLFLIKPPLDIHGFLLLLGKRGHPLGGLPSSTFRPSQKMWLGFIAREPLQNRRLKIDLKIKIERKKVTGKEYARSDSFATWRGPGVPSRDSSSPNYSTRLR